MDNTYIFAIQVGFELLQVTLYTLVTNEVVDLGYLLTRQEEEQVNLVPLSTRGFHRRGFLTRLSRGLIDQSSS